MKRFVRIFLLGAVIYLSLYLVMFPAESLESGAFALTLCFRSVIPALFPYLVCSGCLSVFGAAKIFSRYLSPVMRPLFGVPGSGAIALVLGTVSGYPIGAVCAADLYFSGECTKTEAERLLAFCNNSGPLFVVSVVGCSFLKSPHTGMLLYLSHVLSAVLTGIIFRTLVRQKHMPTPHLLPKTAPNTKNTLSEFGRVLDSAVFAILKICGFVVFFTVFVSSLPKTPLSPYIHSLIEITGGTAALISSDTAYNLKLPLVSFFIAFSGLSVILQVGAVTAPAKLSLKPFIWGKLIQGVLSFFITHILVSNLSESTDAFAKNAAWEVNILPYDVFVSSVFMLLFGLIVLFSILGIARINPMKPNLKN